MKVHTDVCLTPTLGFLNAALNTFVILWLSIHKVKRNSINCRKCSL